jgi:hypothetical protein
MSLWSCWKSPCHVFTSLSCSLREKSSLPVFCKCGEPCGMYFCYFLDYFSILLDVRINNNALLSKTNITMGVVTMTVATWQLLTHTSLSNLDTCYVSTTDSNFISSIFTILHHSMCFLNLFAMSVVDCR